MSLARDLPTAVQTAIESGLAVAPFYMAFFDFVGDPTRLHNTVGVVEYDGHDWLPVPGGLTPFIEELQGKTTDVTMRMPALDTDLINHARNLDYDNRTAQALVGFLSIVEGTVIGATEVRYGEMQDVSVVFGQYGEPSHIDVVIEDEISQLDQTKGLFFDTVTVKQRLNNPNTNLFKHTPRLETLDFKLGPVKPSKRRTEGLLRHEKIGRLF